MIGHLRGYPLTRPPPPPAGEMGKTDLMRSPMAFPFFFSFYRVHMLTCYPSYINYQMPLCCSLSLLSWHKYKIGVVIGLWDPELKFSRCSNSFQLSRVRKPACSLDFLKLITIKATLKITNNQQLILKSNKIFRALSLTTRARQSVVAPDLRLYIFNFLPFRENKV